MAESSIPTIYLVIVFAVIFLIFPAIVYLCCRRKYRKKTDTNCCLLLIYLPFLPFIWLYYFIRRHKLPCYDCIQRCCDVRRPGGRNHPPKVLTINKASREGFSWYLHSYMACLKHWGCFRFDWTKDLTVIEAIKRYVEGPQKDWDVLVSDIKENVYLNFLIEYLNRREPKLYFRILPSGSIREGFGYPVNSTSVLASDYDLMLVPDGIFVYDEFTQREDGFPVSFTAIDDPTQNPERPKGFLWLKLEKTIEVWKNLCYERLTSDGVIHYLSQLAVLDVIIDQIGKPAFLKQFNDQMHGAKSEKKYTICSERTGPALNVSITRHKLFQKIPCLEKILREPEKLLDADFTLALACPKFPRDGKYFFERREENEKIHWPGREVVNKIEQLGCHVVPKPSKKTLASFQKEQMADSFLGTSAVLEWRYSFSQAEMVLSDHVPQAIRTSYLAFKAVIKTHINRVFDAEGLPHKIPSYALKTILFYELENMPVNFNAKEIEEKFFWILFESLQQKIDSKKCPHYWIKSLDLFSDIKEIDFEFMKDQLNRIKQRPIEYIASEWLEWNRYMRQHCCASCIEPYKLKRKVVGDDFKPLPCCCFVTLNMKRDKDDEEEVKIVYDDVAIEVY